MSVAGLLLATWLGASAAAAPAPEAPLAVYEEAARRGAVGAVVGRAVEDGRRPGDPPVPLDGVTVTLLPWSASLVRAMEDVRRLAREDERVYRTAGRRLLALKRADEQALAGQGGGHLVRSSTAGRSGRFELADVPAGRWLLVAERRHFVPRPAAEPGRRAQRMFVPRPKLEGYHVLTVWLRELEVSAGGVVEVDLGERGAWMRAVDEVRRDDGS